MAIGESAIQLTKACVSCRFQECFFEGVAKLVIATACHAVDRGFESRHSRFCSRFG